LTSGKFIASSSCCQQSPIPNDLPIETFGSSRLLMGG
jgi:hypothetical protein